MQLLKTAGFAERNALHRTVRTKPAVSYCLNQRIQLEGFNTCPS
mgnify:CR=1 FL=1